MVRRSLEHLFWPLIQCKLYRNIQISVYGEQRLVFGDPKKCVQFVFTVSKDDKFRVPKISSPGLLLSFSKREHLVAMAELWNPKSTWKQTSIKKNTVNQMLSERMKDIVKESQILLESVIYSSISSENFRRRFIIPRKNQSKLQRVRYGKSLILSRGLLVVVICWIACLLGFLIFLLSYWYSLSPDEVRLDLFFRPARIKSSSWYYLGSFAASRADVFQETQVSTPWYDNGDDDNDCSTKSWWHRILQNGVVSSCCGEGRQLCVLT